MHHHHHHHPHYHVQHQRMTPISWANDIIIVGATTTLTTPSTEVLAAQAGLDYKEVNDNHHDYTTLSIMSPTTPEDDGGEEGVGTANRFFRVWGVAVVLMALSVVTLVSNSTILTMFVLRKSLRRCKNIYIASLAAADLAIGLTLPVAALEQVESRWVLEGVACHLYQTVRCSLLYVSLLSILLITLDRWWSIHYPFTYRVRQSKRLAIVAVIIVWIVGFALHVPPTLVWDYVIGREEVNDVENNDVDSTYSSPSQFLSMLTTVKPETLSSEASDDVFPGTPGESSGMEAGLRRMMQEAGSGLESVDRRRCELPYNLHFTFVLTVSLVLYFFPLLSLWVLNCSLYFKITRRKSIKIRRSLSVNDNYLLTFRKSSSESENSPNNGGDNDSLDIRSAEQRQRLLAAARAGRRHTLAFPGHHPRFGGNGAGSVYYPSQNGPRTNQTRRVSLQDAFTGIGSMAALAGAIHNLPRVTSCGRFSANGGPGASSSLVPMGLWYGSGPRHSVCSSRKQSDDLVKELLVRQDKKAARLLGLLVTVFTLCWLPHTVLAVLRANDKEAVSGWVLDVVSWVLVTNSAINPFLYGLLNAEFRKILRGWFYFRRQSNYRLKHALLYWSLPPNGDSDGLKEAPATHGLFATPIKE